MAYRNADPISFAEVRLLLDCTRPRADSRIGHQLSAINVDLLHRLAHRNRVLPLVMAALQPHMPPDGQGPWRAVARHASRLSLLANLLHRETIELLQEMHEHGIAVCPLKGSFLSQRLYGQPALRPSSDIDLLIERSHFVAALQLLRRRGYVPGRGRVLPEGSSRTAFLQHYQAKHVHLVNRSNRVRVELHWRVTTLKRFPGEQQDKLWQRLELRTDIDATPAYTMSDADLLVYLAMHGASHDWSRLSWLADFVWAASHPVALAVARATAAEHGLSVIFESACILADRTYATKLAAAAQTTTQARRIEFLIARSALLRADAQLAPGDWLQRLWHSYDSAPASLRGVAQFCLTPTGADVSDAATSGLGMQRWLWLRYLLGRIAQRAAHVFKKTRRPVRASAGGLPLDHA